MYNRYLKTAIGASLAILLQVSFVTVSAAQTAPPPNLGEETKGKPAIVDTNSDESQAEKSISKTEASAEEKVSAFGTATVTESRRESGQLYRIELEHSAGAKQVIEENDSDGNIENTESGIDDTPNLPKWKLGSW